MKKKFLLLGSVIMFFVSTITLLRPSTAADTVRCPHPSTYFLKVCGCGGYAPHLWKSCCCSDNGSEACNNKCQCDSTYSHNCTGAPDPE